MPATNNVIDRNSDKKVLNPAANPEIPALLSGYQEICKSYHAIDDFRMKLLGLLPLASLIGIFSLSNESLLAQLTPMAQELITFIGIFAATFTLALFIFEIRGILRCDGLIKKGRDIEALLKIRGQFFLCHEEYECQKFKPWQESFINFFDAKLAACVIYSTVFAAWLFTVLRFGFNGSIYGCAFSALGIGLVMGGSAFYLVKKLIAA